MGNIKLLGFDLGTTTCKCLLLNSELHDNHVLGRSELRHLQTIYRSDPVFTPYLSQTLICEIELEKIIDRWFHDMELIDKNTTITSAIVTGLAAQKQNAQAIERILRKFVGASMMITTTDPRLESWVAFMGSALKISQENPTSTVINIDIGGGTANLALAKNGRIFDTGSYFIGSRHIIFQPGTYQILNYTEYAQRLSQAINLDLEQEATLSSYQIDSYTNRLVQNLAAALYGKIELDAEIVQAGLANCLSEDEPHIITFSGGVAELLYNSTAHSITAYGDLGYELVAAIKRSGLSKDISRFMPENKGRATVFGLSANCFELSGNSIYVSNDFEIPLGSIPVVGQLHYEHDLERLPELMTSIKRIGGKAALYISFTQINLENIKRLSQMMRLHLNQQIRLVLITEANIGKTLGSYITDWGRERLSLLVLDQIKVRPAQFVHIGDWVENCLPVTFFGLT